METSLTEHPNAALVRKAFDDWATGRASFYDILAPDAVWTIPGTSPHCGTWHSREAFLTDMVRPFLSCFSTFSFTVRKIWTDGDTVAVHWDSQATDRDGRPYSNAYVYVIALEGGFATSVTAFLDMVAFNDVWNRFL